MSNSGETNIESLQRSWRKVASTHDLQTLAECTDEPRHSGGLRSKLLGWVPQQSQPVSVDSQHMVHTTTSPQQTHPEDDGSCIIRTSSTLTATSLLLQGWAPVPGCLYGSVLLSLSTGE